MRWSRLWVKSEQLQMGGVLNISVVIGIRWLRGRFPIKRTTPGLRGFRIDLLIEKSL
jgi:hypothetical protein